MDIAALLRQARDRAGMSQSQLARAAGTGQAAVSRYERGTLSPTVATFDRLLAACGVQARVKLEPLLADVDARLDAMLAGEVGLEPREVLELEQMALSLDDDPDAPWGGLGTRPTRKGAATWAFDGATALRMQGLAVTSVASGGDVELVAVLDEALRSWLFVNMTQGRDAGGYAFGAWLGGQAEDLRDVVGRGVYSPLGFFVLRLVDELPARVSIQVSDGGRPLPVLTVDEVERAHPAHAEVLARWRERRTVSA